VRSGQLPPDRTFPRQSAQPLENFMDRSEPQFYLRLEGLEGDRIPCPSARPGSSSRPTPTPP
jgi:hypothetical protein